MGELGAVCQRLRKDARLDVRRDMEFYVRRDYRTIEKFEQGKPTDHPDIFVEGYALALGMTVSQICQLAVDEIRKREQAGAAVAKAAGEIAQGSRPRSAKPGRNQRERRNRGASS